VRKKVGALMPCTPLTKSDRFFNIARRSIVACSPIYGAWTGVLAEERQAVPNYKELIHNVVKTSFIDPSSVGLVEISPLHPTRGPQLGDWMACLRIVINGQPTFYVAFIDSSPPVVSLFRRVVRFDDCDKTEYEPISSPPPVQDRPAGRPRMK
jgi:hypothetical protein